MRRIKDRENVKSARIMVCVKPGELETIMALAEKEASKTALMARRLILEGMKVLKV